MPKNTVNLKKLERLEAITFKNALRLHFDSILLYKNKSYPSAYFLSILALEELGKVSLLDHFIFNAIVNGRMDSEIEILILGQMYQHRPKQIWFANDAEVLLPKRVWKEIRSGSMELCKQNSVYVGLNRKNRKLDPKSKIISPLKLKRKKAKEKITVVNDYLLILITRYIGGFGTSIENYIIDKMLNKHLLSKLTRLWKFKSNRAKREIAKLQATT